MSVRIVRLGSARGAGEGLRIGTVRRLPRGVRKDDYAKLDWFDVWLPELAPSEALLAWARSQPWTATRWSAYERRYRTEMRQPPAARLLTLLSALSATAAFSVGCYCDDPARCHRSVLAQLLWDRGADVLPTR